MPKPFDTKILLDVIRKSLLSTDDRWRVPHFEKMLYDNALLAVIYLEAWQATGREDFARGMTVCGGNAAM